MKWLPKWRMSINVRVMILLIGLVLAVVSLLYTNQLARILREKEQNDVKLWVAAMERVSGDVVGNAMIDPLISHIVSTHNNIPFIITDEDLNPVVSNRIEEEILADAELYRAKIDQLTEEYTPRVVAVKSRWQLNAKKYIIFYGQSQLLKALYYFPYVQILIVFIFLIFTYIALQSAKRDEQNQVWIGLAKETAHQLGTPISSLMAWVEVLKENYPQDELIPEMSKVVKRLERVAERF